MESRKGQTTTTDQVRKTTAMGTGASSVERHQSTTSMVSYEPRDPKSVMFKSARKGNEKDLTFVLHHGMDPNEKESQFSSLRALHFTARHGHSQCLEILIECGADVTAKDFYGWQAIHEAALNGHTECLALLLKHGAKVDSAAYNTNGPNTPLHYAARHGHEESVRLLLTHGANWKSINNFGETPLHYTAMRGHVDCMQILVQAGADINSETRDGLTPAYFSALCGHSRYLKEVIKQGTDINKKYKAQTTLLHNAAQAGKIKVLKALLRNGANTEIHSGPRSFTPMHLAARIGQNEGIELLIKYGASMEALSAKGYTPLHHASRCGKLEVGKVLIAYGANVDAISEGDQETPLHMCVHKRDREFTKLLIDANADLNIRDSCGNRPIDMRHLNDDIINMLRAAMFEKERVNTVTTS